MIYSNNDSGRTVITAGAAKQLNTSSIPCDRIDIQAHGSNTGIVVIGGPSVVAAAGTRTGIALNAGDVYSLELVTDAINIWIDGTVNADVVTWSWWRGSNV